MFRAYQRLTYRAAVCLVGLTATTWAEQYPCTDEQCIPAQRASAAPAEEAPAEAAPADEDNPVRAAAARGPVTFAAPAPSGEVEGARNSYSLPSIEFHFPKWQIGTPEFKIRGMGRGRREARMIIDEGTAPLATGAPAMYGPLIGAGLQQRAAATAPAAAPAKEEPADAAPADAAPAGCVDPCALKQQQDEVRQLTQQVKQLQGLILQLAEQQASGQVTESAEQDEAANDVSYIPAKARTVSHQTASRSTNGRTFGRERDRQLQQEEELAALEAETEMRQQEIEEGYAQKAAELEEMQARLESMQLEQKRVLEAKLKRIDCERERRLRSRLLKPSANQNHIVQSSSDEETVEVEQPKSNQPSKLFARPTGMKPMPRVPRNAQQEAAE